MTDPEAACPLCGRPLIPTARTAPLPDGTTARRRCVREAGHLRQGGGTSGTPPAGSRPDRPDSRGGA